MPTMLNPVPPDFWDRWHTEQPADGKLRAPGAPDERSRRSAPPQRRRRSRGFLRFLITLGVGVGGTLAWQSYGDVARAMLASAYPDQLGWVAPEPAASAQPAVAPAGATTVGSAAPASAAPAPSADRQQLDAVSLNLTGLRASVERLTTLLAASQQQMAGEIAKLQASEQDILNKIATPPPRPAPARKPAPLTLAPPASATNSAAN